MPSPPLRRSLPFLAACILAGLAGAMADRTRAVEIPSQLEQGPIIRLEERRWDFGRTRQHALVTHLFGFRNDGTAPLVIGHIEPDCGCTAAFAEDTLITPGGASRIKITIDTKTLEGDQQKVVSVYTNDPAEPRIDLVLTMSVAPLIQVEPRTLDFKEVRRGQTPVLTARLTAEKGTGFRVTGIQGAEDRISWSIKPIADTSGVSFLIEARMRPDAPYGRFIDRVEVPVKHPQVRSERIFVRGEVYSYFTLSLQKIRFVPIRPGQEISRNIEILADGSKPYRISQATASVPYLHPLLTRSGNGYALKVTLVAPDQALRFNEQVLLHTTDPNQPEIPIEVRGAVALPQQQTRP